MIQNSLRIHSLIFVIATVWCSVVNGQTNLLIFTPGKQNTDAVQHGFDGLIEKSKVFNRIKDLDSALAASPDVAIIAPEPFFAFTPGYKMVLSGKTGSNAGEKYHIIAVNKEISFQNIKEKKIGIVDFLRKDGLLHFIKDQFGFEIKTVKRANKEDDLLTMLGMGAVDAIIVSDSQYREILTNTKLSLSIIASSSKSFGFLTYGIKEGKNDEKQKKKLMKAPASLLKEIGIDGWDLR